jgi:hypothetical protein
MRKPKIMIYEIDPGPCKRLKKRIVRNGDHIGEKKEGQGGSNGHLEGNKHRSRGRNSRPYQRGSFLSSGYARWGTPKTPGIMVCDVKIETYMQGDGYVVDARASAIIHLLASKDGVR